jgi:RNA polymerase sigma factor (sigma-70 family)
MDGNMELFYNDKNEYAGFAGLVKVKDQEFFVDCRNGSGIDRVIKEMSDLISYLASKFNFDGFDLEDKKQHIALRMIEGIPQFKPDKGAKLSSFLQMRVTRRLINEIRDANRCRKSATNLNNRVFSYHCSCGNVFSSEEGTTVCTVCSKPIDLEKRRWIKQSTVSIDEISDGYGNVVGAETITSHLNSIEIMESLKHADQDTKDIVTMIYNDCPLGVIAKKLGMSQSNVYAKLKKLRRNKKLHDIIRG